MNDLLLSIRNLTIKTGNRILVNDISLDIPSKTVVGLVGESGSGKTLTALSILGLLPHNLKVTGSNIEIFEEKKSLNLCNLNESELNAIRGNHISMIFQEPMTSLNPSMKCGKQAMEILTSKLNMRANVAKKKVLSLFNDVKIPDVERIYNSWPHELSGGQRQRVMIAMALSASPKLLIADEPTTALDVTVQKSILELLAELKDKYNLSILFITHDLMVLNRIADIIAVMYQGRIVESGTKERILTNPSKPYTKGLIACKPGLENNPSRLPVVRDFIEGKNLSPIKTNRRTSIETTNNLLSVSDLYVTFGSKKKSVEAVRSVSFEVFQGETLGLVGESGCGKSTLGRTILQLIKSNSGTIKYKGIALDQLSNTELRKMRRNIQIVFQDPYSSLNPGKTIGNILSEPIKVHKLRNSKSEIEKRVMELLDFVGLENEAVNLYPHEFSGGQRQRIGIARALACEPEFIILDESVSALDVSVQAQILNLLNDLKEKFGLTYIFISHDLTVVKYMSDRILIMSQGEIVESGNPQVIYNNPAHPYTKVLIDAIPL